MAEAEKSVRLWEEIRALASSLGVEVDLGVLCRAAAAHLAQRYRTVAGVAVSVPAGPVLAAQTIADQGPFAREVEELQVTLGQGPSLDVSAGADLILVLDLADPEHDLRWPQFAPAAAQAGVGSLCVLPVRVGAARLGVFAVYLDRPGGLAPGALADAIRFAAIALDLLLAHAADLISLGAADGELDWTRLLLDDRPAIHQATGMIAVQLEVDLATALLRLRARAFADSRRLSELAADVVARRLRFDRDCS